MCISSFDRRHLIKALTLGGAATLLDGTPRRVWKLAERVVQPSTDEGGNGSTEQSMALADTSEDSLVHKSRYFDHDHADDYLVPEDLREVLFSTARRLERAQATIGHGHFNLVDFDSLIRFAKRYSSIGRFANEEIAFLDELFHRDARAYGFQGSKLIDDMTTVLPERDVAKVEDSGHFLLKGASLEKFGRIKRDLGDSVYLTSGIRALGKQFQLFLSKALETDGNLSRASRSLAPPGYSYHATGDFDLGKVGWGLRNFSEEFAETDEYRRLIDLGYVDIRYTPSNTLGVRHEPWHIKIGSPA